MSRLEDLIEPSKVELLRKNKLVDIHKEVQFHKKFWGVSIEEEREKWAAENKELIDGRTNQMQVEADSTEIPPYRMEDYIEGCFAMSVAPFRDPPILWVRAEYIRIFDFINKQLEERNRRDEAGLSIKTQFYVITGQPGCGKTVFQQYSLRMHLGIKKPVITNPRTNDYLLYCEEGVFLLPKEFAPRDFVKHVMVLLDSVQNPDGPKDFEEHESQLDVVYTTSPSTHRWSKLQQVGRCKVLIMNPWTFWEIERAEMLYVIVNSSFIPEATGSMPSIRKVFDELGPTPRLCVELRHDPNALSGYEERLDDALDNLSNARLLLDFQTTKSLQMGAVAHTLFIVYRKEQMDLDSPALVAPMTEHIRARIILGVRQLKVRHQLELYWDFQVLGAGRAMAGNVFEAYCTNRFGREIAFDYCEMVRLPPAQSAWHSPFAAIDDQNEALSSAARVSCADKCEVKHSPPETIMYGGGADPIYVQPDVLYIPELPNQVAIDSFILLNGELLLLQFTVSEKHPIKTGLDGFLQRLRNIPSTEHRRFIFVIPNSKMKRLDTPQVDFLELGPNFKPYCALIDVKDYETK